MRSDSTVLTSERYCESEDPLASTDPDAWRPKRRERSPGASTADPSIPSPRDLRSEGSTEASDADHDVYAELERVFWAANGEAFEDGMESAFSRELIWMVRRHSDQAMEAITHLLVYERVSPEAASEALRWLGRVEDAPTYTYRRWLLERCLLCSSPLVRDGAGLGLASLNDPHAAPYLRHALSNESCIELRKGFDQVLAQLETARPWPSS